MFGSDRLPVAQSGPRTLVDGVGESVWPVPSGRSRAALEGYAAAISCRLENVETRIARSQRRRSGLVVALGQGTREAAELYGHLTYRRTVVAQKASDIFSQGAPAVVVVEPDILGPRFLEALYEPDKAVVAPGILSAEDPENLLHQVLLRSAAVRLGGSGRRFLEFYPWSEFGETVTGRISRIGGLANYVNVREMLTRGSDVLTVLTHSDGIDAMLAPELLCCAMAEPPDNADMSRAPYCVLTKHCFRLGVPVEEALTSGQILHPGEIAARILLLASCFGVMSQDSDPDRRWGILFPLLNSDRLGAVVTTWGPYLSSPSDLPPLLRTLYVGKPVGVALGEFNASSAAIQAGLRFCLFGDPAVRVPQEGAHLEQDGGYRDVTDAPPTSGHDQSAILFLAAVLANAGVSGNCSQDAASTARAALQHVRRYQHIAMNGHQPEVPGGVGPKMREAIMAFLRAYERGLSVDWKPLACDQGFKVDGDRCTNCGLPTQLEVYRFRPAGVDDRVVRSCRECSLTADMPASAELYIWLRGERLYIEGAMPRDPWLAQVRLAYRDRLHEFVYLWPKREDGSPKRSFLRPRPSSADALRLSVDLMIGARLVTLRLENAEAGDRLFTRSN